MSKPVKRALNTVGLDKSLWLVKIPKFVAEEWNTAEDGEELGRLTTTKSSTGEKKLNILLNTQDSSERLKFTLDDVGGNSLKSNDLLAFIHDDEKNQYSIVGKCSKSLMLKPQDSAKYHELRRKRKEAEITKLQNNEAQSTPMLSLSNQSNYLIEISNNDNKKKQKTDVDSGLIRNKIMESFQKDDKQLIRDIFMICRDVPGVSIDNLPNYLKVYANLHTKGMFNSYWELKSEFRIKKTL